MSSLAAACRLSTRIARQRVARDVAIRGFGTCAARLAAQNFTMPALSPTMTEGNIASWRVKEGDKFAAGDVLLEIETDKATMDVEAQEDGVLMKIMQGDGSKSVQVGTRIAVLAEEGDDISALEIPPDESPQAPKESKPEASTQEQAPRPAEAETSAQSSPPPPREKKDGGKSSKQTYPLLPSVAHLMKEHGVDESAIADMTPTGPNGRLLKGDVLAYLGSINASTPAAISERFEKLSHLDLSNIKVAPPKEAPKAKSEAAVPAAREEEAAFVTLPVSLAAVIAAQKKVQDALGVFMPLSTFIARATDVANDELPLSANARPSADDLFNQVLGLDRVGVRGSRGFYLPQITALPPPTGPSVPAARPRPAGRKVDVIDILAAPGRGSRAAVPVQMPVPGISTGLNAFSLVVPKTEERRAKAFLERVKLVLENEPGRLVL